MTAALSILPILSLLGCGGGKAPPHEREPQREREPQQEQDQDEKPFKPENVVSIYIGHTHMSRFSPYWFSLEEKNGETLFSCSYFNVDADPVQEVTIEDLPVDPAYMDQMRGLIGKYGFLNMTYRKPGPFDSQLRDAPMYSLLLGLPIEVDGRTYRESHRLNYFPNGAGEVKAILLALAEKNADKATIISY